MEANFLAAACTHEAIAQQIRMGNILIAAAIAAKSGNDGTQQWKQLFLQIFSMTIIATKKLKGNLAIAFV